MLETLWLVIVDFTISGEPASVAAGNNFTNITVTAYDAYDNIKTNYTGTIQFKTSDLNNNGNVVLNGFNLPAGTQTSTSTQYTFVVGDSGQKTFTSNFALETAGNQTITVWDISDPDVSVTTNVIDVVSNHIASFTLTATNPGGVVAGEPFQLNVTNAVDASGNPASGTVNISFVSSTSNIETSPNGSSPSYTSITVTNGSGSALQTLVRADTNVVLRGTVAANGNTDDTDGADVITVSPGQVDHFTFTQNQTPQAPLTTVTAGQQFSVTIEARDKYDNIVGSGPNNYSGVNGIAIVSDTTNTIYEAEDSNSQIQFTNGIYNDTVGGHLVINQSGQNDIQITVTDSLDSNINGKSSIFTVQPGSADHFTITTNIPGAITAGESIPIRIEARDSNENLLSFGDFAYNVNGIVLDDSDGTANGTINPGTVDFTNGVWEGTVIITEATPVTLRVGQGSGLTPDTIGPITVNPAALDHFVFTTNPDPYVKIDKNIPVVIEARDKYNNLAIGFSGNASINDLTQTIYEAPPVGSGSSDQTITFAVGIYNGNVRVPEVFRNDVITVTSGGASGSSSLFTVVGNNVIVELDNSVTAPKVTLTGTTIDMFEFTLTNLDPSNSMTITGFEIYAESAKDSTIFIINPATLIESMYVYEITSGSPVLIGENLTPNNSMDAVSINLTNSLTINPSGDYKKVKVAIRLKRNISDAVVRNILLRIGDANGQINSTPSVPVDPANDDFESIKEPEHYIRSGLTNIRSDEKTAAFNYPNPFNPRSQSTRIAFYNSVDNGIVSIRIYTLTGRLVRDLSLKTAQLQGSIEVEWNGKNGKGRVVRNGVYVAVISLSDGTKMMVKIAVIK